MKLQFLNSIIKSFLELRTYIKLNKLIWILLIGFMLAILTIVFSFIALAPALSPFIYPLL